MSGSMRWFALGSGLLLVLAVAVLLLVLNRDDAGVAEPETLGTVSHGPGTEIAVPV